MPARDEQTNDTKEDITVILGLSLNVAEKHFQIAYFLFCFLFFHFLKLTFRYGFRIYWLCLGQIHLYKFILINLLVAIQIILVYQLGILRQILLFITDSLEMGFQRLVGDAIGVVRDVVETFDGVVYFDLFFEFGFLFCFGKCLLGLSRQWISCLLRIFSRCLCIFWSDELLIFFFRFFILGGLLRNIDFTPSKSIRHNVRILPFLQKANILHACVDSGQILSVNPSLLNIDRDQEEHQGNQV